MQCFERGSLVVSKQTMNALRKYTQRSLAFDDPPNSGGQGGGSQIVEAQGFIVWGILKPKGGKPKGSLPRGGS